MMQSTQLLDDLPVTSLLSSPPPVGSSVFGCEFGTGVEFASESPGSQRRLALSPTISKLNHQEIVETDSCLSPIIENDFIPETTDLFSFELESNGIPNALRNVNNSSTLAVDLFDLIDTSDTSGELDDIQLSPIPRSHAGPETIQPDVSTSQQICSVPSCSSIIPCPVPSRIYVSAVRSDSKRERKSPPSRAEFSAGENRPDDTFHVQRIDDVELDATLVHTLNSPDDGEEYSDEFDGVDFAPPSSQPTTPSRCPDKYLHNEDLISGRPGQRLCLSAEETKMLQAMGVQIPKRFPLSRSDERALRTVRRRIRNKLSAQASRARRQEYVADLEHRVKMSDKENQRLRRQVVHLQNDKRDLIAHVRRLRSYVSKILYKDDKSTILPLFVRSTSKPNHSVKSATQAATAAAGGTSLLIITFMILGWTATMPVSPVHNGSTTVLSIPKPDKVFSFFPGRSRSLLESNTLDTFPGSVSKTEVDSREYIDPASNTVVDSAQIPKLDDQLDLLTLEDTAIEHYETNDSTHRDDYETHPDRVPLKENKKEPFLSKETLEVDKLSLSGNFISTLDL